jgi:hypothetical protein
VDWLNATVAKANIKTLASKMRFIVPISLLVEPSQLSSATIDGSRLRLSVVRNYGMRLCLGSMSEAEPLTQIGGVDKA